jgi:hypothetical protein
MPVGWLSALILGLNIASANGQSAKKVPATGIFYLTKSDSVEYPFENLASSRGWTNPNVAGVSLRSQWNKVESSEGGFDWSFLDEGVRLAAQHHKKISISVTAGVSTPDWVYAAGAYRWNIHKLRKGGSRLLMSQPLPWDSVLLSKWGDFVRALAARYDNTPDLAYVVMGGPGRRAESFFVDSPEDIAELESKGGISRWVQGSEKIVDRYASAFVKTPFILAIGPPIPSDAGRVALHQLIDYGADHYPGRFGIMSDGLRPRYEMASFGAQVIRALSTRCPVGFQMLLPSKGGRQMPEGTLADAIQRGFELGAHFIEIYSIDCDDPNQASGLQELNAKLLAKFGNN